MAIFKLYDLSNQDDYINVDFKSIYNDTDETVSIGLKIPTTESDDILIITFKVNKLLTLVATDLPWRFNTGNDQKVFYLEDETIIDRKTNGEDLSGTSDGSVGGTTDFDCKAIYDGTHYNVEFSAPQYSYDLLGKDFNLKTFNSTEFFVWYFDDSTQTTYSQILEANVSRDYCYLKTSVVTLTINSLLLIGSFVSTLLLVASVRLSKRKKSIKNCEQSLTRRTK